VTEAENAEKFIKGKTRAWKKALISKHNPNWIDFADKVKGGIL
jgi:predicted GIY-YIG superfamily endonuclease